MINLNSLKQAGTVLPSLLVWWLALNLCVPAMATPTAYQMPNTFVHQLPSKSTNRAYQVWVDLPASYTGGKKQYPVVFVTDPQYAFTLVHGIRHLLGRRGQNIEDFILVGLALPANEDAAESRSRDYTPSNALINPKPSQYRADMSRKVFIGHSYGALWGAATLLTKPDMFQAYILGSPSLWFDDKVIFQLEQQYATNHKDLKAKVLLFAGSFETPGPGPRYYKDTDLVGDLKRLKDVLVRRRYPGLHLEGEVVQGEDHFTVYPALVGRGLLKVLPGYGPYISG
jgi:predicted alpha/beta superfamily hydrolase